MLEVELVATGAEELADGAEVLLGVALEEGAAEDSGASLFANVTLC